jgi:hypothetical protein
MSIGISLVDRLHKEPVEIDVTKGEKNALVVAQRDLKEYDGFLLPFFNPTYGVDMNINAAYSGTPESIHNGTDNVYWTATAISGVKFTFDSLLQNHTPAGTKSVWSNRSAVGDTAQFAKGSSLDLSDYVAITFWIYVEDNWAAGDSVILYGWDTATGAVGISIAIEDYIESGRFGSWQKAAVPLEQMNLVGETVDSLRLEIATRSGLAPSFFIDDIQFEEVGEAAVFTLAPDPGTWFWVDQYRAVFAAPYDTSQVDGTVPGLSYDDFLGINIVNGIVYLEQSARSSNAFAFRQLSDVLQIPTLSDFGVINDGTNTMIWFATKNLSPGLVLKAEDDESINFIIQDDLSGLLLARVIAVGGVEKRQ